jgi:antitoxin component HigA of HigAB toxin-antitoxin module
MTNLKPIRTEADYEAALVRIDEIFEAEHGSLEGRELDVLVDLVEFYESKNFPMESSNITEESGEIINRSRADLVLA